VRRRLTIACGLAVLLLASCGGDDNKPAASATERSPKAQPTATTKAPLKHKRRPPAPDPRVARIERALTELVEATELNEATRVCAAIAGGTGSDAQRCAETAGIDLLALPSSEELSFERVRAVGTKAQVVLSSGAVFSLTRSGGRWRVSGLDKP
jgi:hypothetical protein